MESEVKVEAEVKAEEEEEDEAESEVKAEAEVKAEEDKCVPRYPAELGRNPTLRSVIARAKKILLHDEIMERVCGKTGIKSKKMRHGAVLVSIFCARIFLPLHTFCVACNFLEKEDSPYRVSFGGIFLNGIVRLFLFVIRL